jgi:hypothetical protein
MTDEEKYKSLRNALRSLPRVKARSGFEERLFQRLKLAEEGKLHPKTSSVSGNTSRGWFANLFRPAFAPALGLTVILLVGIVVYFVYYNQLKKEESSSPKEYTVSSSNQKPELIIHVKKDTSRYAGNYPHEFSALSDNETSTNHPESKQDFGKVPSDFNGVKPSPTTEEKEKTLDDRISNEQKFEMQRSSEIEPKGKADETETKKSDHIERRMDKKAPSNYNREEDKDNKNDGVKSNGDTFENQNNPPSIKADEKANDATDNEGLKGVFKDTIKLGKSKKDSVRAKEKAPLKTEEPDTTNKK